MNHEAVLAQLEEEYADMFDQNSLQIEGDAAYEDQEQVVNEQLDIQIQVSESFCQFQQNTDQTQGIMTRNTYYRHLKLSVILHFYFDNDRTYRILWGRDPKTGELTENNGIQISREQEPNREIGVK